MATALPPGIYVPIPTFFAEESAGEQQVDTDTLARHVKFLCTSGVHGIVCMGSTGEAVHLTEEERQLVIRTTRKTIDDLGSKAKVIAGCSQESVQGTLTLIEQAKQAGADYVMVLPPSYFLGWTINRSDVLVSFYTKVADKSPLPIVIYNFPGVTQQMDTPEETVVKLAGHANIVGIKCTDANVGKAAYVCGHTDSKEFTLMSGSADSFIPFLTVGAQGCVPGFGNIAPRLVVRLFDLYNNNRADQWDEIQRLQKLVAGPDHALFRFNGISGLKAAMQAVLGYGGLARAPLVPSSPETQEKILKGIEPAMVVERELAGKASSE